MLQQITSLSRATLIIGLTAALVALAALIAATPGPRADAGTAELSVNTTDDNDDGNCNSTHCSLREAINRANDDGVVDTINFDIDSSSDPNCISFGDPDLIGVCTIELQSQLPEITSPVLINGYSQSGASENNLAVGNDADLKIVIDLGDTVLGTSGLVIQSDSTTVKGLVINGAGVLTNGLSVGAGIFIDGGSNNVIEGNFLGTNVTGSAAVGLDGAGVYIDGGANNTIGGTTLTARNVISGNDSAGVEINESPGNIVAGNHIGTNAAGTAAIPNGGPGVLLGNAANNTIGGTTPQARNVISGNLDANILVAVPAATGNVIQGNYIGTNASGTAAIGGGLLAGIAVDEGAGDTLIGGTSSGAQNVISGNESHGVLLFGTLDPAGNNIVQGNYIGTNAAGTGAIPNAGSGVLIIASDNNTIGGTSAGARNVISGNDGDGITISGASSTANTVEGNFVGTNAAGDAAVPNTAAGVNLSNSAEDNTVGGTTSGGRNVISGNADTGVLLQDGATENRVQGNYIGANAAGTGAVPNDFGVAALDSTANLIGGDSAAAGNLISGNEHTGIFFIGSNGNSIIRNTITDNGSVASSFPGGIVLDVGSLRTTILANSIHSNEGLGIDLLPLGVTPNDPGDSDFVQNFPELTSALAGSITISGTFDSTPNTEFRFEFFVNDECDPSGHGEGQTFLGADNVTTDGDGMIPFEASSNANVPAGKFITATATNLDTGDTSEFSNCVEVQGPEETPTLTATPPGQTPTPTPTPTPPGQTPTPTPIGQTPTPTPSAQTATPTPTPTGTPEGFLWGDVDCSGAVDPVDSLKLLRFDAGLSVAQAQDCPPVGQPYGDELWGDLDCSEAVDPVDALKGLRHDAGLSVTQDPDCPGVARKSRETAATGALPGTPSPLGAAAATRGRRGQTPRRMRSRT